ncbi:MAG: ribosome assembly RNA-binding protein YhbY [Gammaproteobacteria bacterium]|nr:ribosome assembly RNA-binding protein YhbY [Gammaproteobacteria bacterium]
MALTGKQKNHLRGLAHSLKPVVTIGANGITDAVIAELDLSLNVHELLKLKLPAVEKEDKNAAIEELCRRTSAEAVQSIGRVVVLFRANEESKITLPR